GPDLRQTRCQHPSSARPARQRSAVSRARATVRARRRGAYASAGSAGRLRLSATDVEDHFGAMRIAPSRRIVSPLSIGLATIDSTSWAYSVGLLSRAGWGTDLPRDSCASAGTPAIIGVSKMPGAMVTTRMREAASSRAIGRVTEATAPLDAE